ncbi:uncharacterized protein LOC142903271 [Nelusetta ayraudi]|uniref:uncharacterized protein LOC142903271 n=1 Tax=Nelusetta ayraudi TaxID=303726 RepID=UPI003F702EE4
MFGFLISALRRVLQCLLAAMLLMLYAPPEENQQENKVHRVQVRLAAAGRSYLGALAGEQTVLWLQETLSPLLDTGMNVTFQQVSLCFKAAGFKDDLEVSAVAPQYMVLVLQGVLLAIALYWPLSVAFRLASPFLWAAWKTTKALLSMLAFTLGFKRFPFSVGKLKIKLKKNKKTEEEEQQGKSQDGECEKKSSSFSKLFRRNKNKPKEAAE